MFAINEYISFTVKKKIKKENEHSKSESPSPSRTPILVEEAHKFIYSGSTRTVGLV